MESCQLSPKLLSLTLLLNHKRLSAQLGYELLLILDSIYPKKQNEFRLIHLKLYQTYSVVRIVLQKCVGAIFLQFHTVFVSSKRS